jgi:hypothetical protein
MWPVANVAFGMAAPEKTIHYGGGFREDGEAEVFRNQKELGMARVGKFGRRNLPKDCAVNEKRAAPMLQRGDRPGLSVGWYEGQEAGAVPN